LRRDRAHQGAASRPIPVFPASSTEWLIFRTAVLVPNDAIHQNAGFGLTTVGETADWENREFASPLPGAGAAPSADAFQGGRRCWKQQSPYRIEAHRIEWTET
jgi:hypothetical protein